MRKLCIRTLELNVEWSSNLEEAVGRPGLQGTVLNVGLFREILSALYRRLHPSGRQESRQIGGVGRNYDQSKKPPDSSHHSCGNSPRSQLTSCQSDNINIVTQRPIFVFV